MALTILEGSTFCLSDERGDIVEPTMGFFTNDTRFLSRWLLTVNGARPLLLSSYKVEYYSAAFYLRNPTAGGLGHDEISIGRDRFVGDGMQEHITVTNHAAHPREFELALELGSDFADIFAVKAYDFGLGIPESAPPLPQLVAPVYEEDDNQFILADDSGCLTQVVVSERGEVGDGVIRFRLALEPRERWRVRIDVIPAVDGLVTSPSRAERVFGDELTRVRESLSAWKLRVPQVRASWDNLHRSFAQSVADLASLRMDEDPRLPGQLPAAGMPWFMTVFGRDTLITCLQTLLFGPELAQNALTVLAELQATEDDATVDAEPGKIVHEVRHGKGAAAWFPRYYGTFPRYGGGRTTPPSCAGSASPLSGPSSGSTSGATRTATASSSTGAARSAVSPTSPGRTRATRSASTTAARRSRPSRPARCRDTSTTRSCARPKSPGSSGATASSPTGSCARRRS